MATLPDVLRRHDGWIERFTGSFEAELGRMVASAQARVIATLQERLSITRGVIDRTAANQRVLRQVDDFLMDAMERAGFDHLVQEFVQGFPGQAPYFDEMLDAISREMQRPLRVALTKADEAVLASQQVSTAENLWTIVDAAGAAAKRKALFSVGALSFGDVAEQIAVTFNRSIAEASTLAATSTSMFFRTITERGFKQIEAGLPEGAVRYRYDGPKDKLTRPFCERMLKRGRNRPMTREAIEKLENGQLPNPFVTGGGYNCRHQWVITEIRDGRKKS